MQRLINIDQIRGNFFGGLPYSVNWSFGNGEEASKLTISVVSENGTYQTPTLSFQKPEKIKLGNFSFEGYLVGYSFNDTPSQKLLELEYVDKFVNLDKWFVGLHKKHGDKNSGGTDRLILVGKQYHPCDIDLDSRVEYSENEQKQIDYCDPCPYMPEDKYDSACDPILSDFEIFEVYYTFNELISRIPSEFSVEIRNPDRYSKYKAQHVGSLKSVLSSWCSDLGISYYWDPFLSKLVFIDRSKPIKIPKKPTNWEIIDFSEGKNISSTFSRGFIGSFEKAGEIKDYNCRNETIETVRCLNIADLYPVEQDQTATENTLIRRESDVRELTVAVSYLGISARNMFLWFWFYQINNPEDLKNKYKLTKEEASGSSKEADLKLKTKILKFMGNMKVLEVFYKEGTPKENQHFESCKKKMQDADKERLAAEDKKEGYSATEFSYYFFVAEIDEELAKKQNDVDTDLAKNFLGKYWFKTLNTTVPGATNSNTEISAESPEGNVTWKRTDEDLKGLPIFNYGHDEKSLIGQLAVNFEKDAKENDELERKYQEAAKSFTEDKVELRSLKSFLLLERDGKWFPNEDFIQYYDSLFKWYQEYTPQVFSTADGRPEFLFNIYPEAKTNKNIKLFFGRKLKTPFDLEASVEAHPLEPKTQKQKTEEEQDVLGNTIVTKQGAWGLRSPKTVKIKLGGDRGITFFCPAQSFGNSQLITEGERGQTEAEKQQSRTNIDVQLGTDDGSAGYSVFVTASADFKKVLPKIEFVYTEGIKNFNVAKIDFNLKQITEDNMKVINNRKCLPKKSSFDRYARTISEFSHYSMAEPQGTMSFKAAGVFPLVYDCSQGLSSVQIAIADDGVYTTYGFEDLIVQPPSEDYFNQYLRDVVLPKKSVGSLKSLTAGESNSVSTAVSSRSN
jgi:hypothetical protein